MSAGRLRECARELREAPHFSEQDKGFCRAVADWLESVAGASVPPGTDAVDAGRSINDRDEALALAVVSAFLGEPASYTG